MAYYTKGTAPAPNPTIWDPLLAITDGLGGGMLDTTELDATRHGGYLLKGCPMYLDFATKVAHPVKSGVVINGGTTTVPFVNKNHIFKVGDIAYVSGAAATITGINTTTSTLYDVITFNGAVAGATVGAILIAVGAAGVSEGVKYVANCLLGDTTKIVTGATAHLIFRINQWVNSALLPFSLPEVTKASLAPNIIIK